MVLSRKVTLSEVHLLNITLGCSVDFKKEMPGNQYGGDGDSIGQRCWWPGFKQMKRDGEN